MDYVILDSRKRDQFDPDLEKPALGDRTGAGYKVRIAGSCPYLLKVRTKTPVKPKWILLNHNIDL